LSFATPFLWSGCTFRVVPPRWAHDPLSGEGARLHGGRYNALGQPAFYSALDPHTAYAEYTQNLFDRPGLLCSFDIINAQLLDLRTDKTRDALGVEMSDLSVRWAGRNDIATQRLAAVLMPQGIDGLLYASLQHAVGGNLVLWRWNGADHDVTATLRDRLGEAVMHPL
jgi:RES domain-containing protein